MRRKWMARWLMVTLVWMAIGLWVIDSWLGEYPWRFIIWWGICAVLAIVMMVFALYDSLAVYREERKNR